MTNTFVDISLSGDKISKNLKRSSFIILTAALVISGFFVFVNTASANGGGAPAEEVWVDVNYTDATSCAAAIHSWEYDCFNSIQDGIDAVAEGGTVNVAAETYEEGSLTFNKNGIALIGSGVGETIIITSSNTYGVSVPSGVNDITIKDLTIREDGTYNTAMCSGSSSERFHLKITHNFGFTIENVNLEGPEKNNSCIVGLDLNSVQNVTVRNVRISGYSTNGVGVAAKHSSEDIATSNLLFDGITIDNNGYTGSTGWAGISFYTFGSGGGTGDINNVQFSGTNTISNNPMGIYVENTDGDVYITGTGATTLSGNSVGPLVTTNIRDLSIVDIYAKDIFNVPVRLENAFAAYSMIVGYWSDVASAGAAANNILADGNPIIFNLLDNEWYVVDDMSIQEAIDAATTSDTINVAAGTYVEHIVITKSNLSLLGEDKETTIIDAKQDASWPVAKPGILIGEYPLVDGVQNVTVSGFTIRDAAMQEGGVPYEGDKYGVGPGGLAGIQIYNSSNNIIENNILINNYWQVWLVAEWPSAGYTECMNNRIANNIIQNSENDGVYLYSDGGVFVQNTEIIENEISNASGTAASGIEFWGWPEGGDTPTISGTVISGNNITSCTYGVRIREDVGDATGTSVHLNNFADNSVQVSDEAEVLVIENVLTDNTFDRTVTIDRSEESLLHTIWSKIQDAIDAATTSDTVIVAAGTYNEQVVIDKQLTLNGANADVNAVNGTRGSESIIYGETSTAVTISADDVIVDGFTLDGGITLDDTANLISGGAISNNIITGADNSEDPPKAQNGIRLGWDYGKGVDGITIEDNTITNSLCKGIRFANTKEHQGGPPQHTFNITISGNEITNNGSAGMETYGPGSNTIINNTISDNDGNGINLKFDDSDVVTGNTITNNTGPGITLRQVTNTTVENNSMSSHTSEEVINTCKTVPGGKGSGIHIFDVSENNTIRFNDISGNNYGVFIHSKGDLEPSNNSINNNKITGNTKYGILNALVSPSAPVDATNNWWGTTVVSEVQAMVSDSVNYSPWYANQEMTSLAGTPVDNQLTLPTEVDIVVTTDVGEVTVEIPAGITVTGEKDWTGEINAPEFKSISSVTVIPERRKTATVSAVIEIGFGDMKLTFNKAVRIAIAGQAGKYAGYSRSGLFTPITTICTADTQVAGDALPAEGDCKINVWPDLVIWTKHFTKFIAYTQTPIVAIGGGTTGIDTIAPSISAISVVARSNSATISWKTNESSLTWIVYGTSTDYGEESKTTSYTASHSVTLSNLSPETTYHYQIKSKDSNGNIGSYTDKTFTTSALEEKITGDIDGDNKVDISDFNLLIVNWGDSPSNLAADLDGNGKVDIFDFNLLMVNWW